MCPKKPNWMKKRIKNPKNIEKTREILSNLDLNSVCENAHCPNMGECFAKKTATFMIMGNICTRNCRFCAVQSGEPQPLDKNEPQNLAKAVKKLGLQHVVITSVTRDDLKDGGATHFKNIVKQIQELTNNSEVTIEVLTPDFKMNKSALDKILKVQPDIFNHNLETVPRLYSVIRPEAEYQRSLDVLNYVKKNNQGNIFTKSGIMLGMGEKKQEIINIMKDLREIDCDIITIGQYLQPGPEHYPVKKYIKPEEFKEYENIGQKLGFKYVAAGPYIRSSYQAADFFEDINN